MAWGARNLISTQVRRLNKVADAVIRRDFKDKVTVRRDAYPLLSAVALISE